MNITNFISVGLFDKFEGYVYTYGIDDPGYSRPTISKIVYYGVKDGKFVYEYRTNLNVKHGFVFLAVNRYTGEVAFEAKFVVLISFYS